MTTAGPALAYVEAFNSRDLARLRGLYHADFRAESPSWDQPRTADETVDGIVHVWETLPDVRFDVLHATEAGTTVVLELTLSWTHPDTGHTYSTPVADVFETTEGLLHRLRAYLDATVIRSWIEEMEDRTR